MPAETPSSLTISKAPTSPVAVQVRAATQLTAEVTHRNHADRVGILLAKQHHGAGRARLLQRDNFPLDRFVRRDPCPHLLRDLVDLCRTHRFQVGEIEPQPVIGDLRSLLLRMLAQRRLERVVQGYALPSGHGEWRRVGPCRPWP